MGYFKNKQIEERETTMSEAVDFDLQQKEAMEIFYKEQERIKKIARRVDKLSDILYYTFLAIASFGIGHIFVQVFL